jgi:lipoate-protein ligase A
MTLEILPTRTAGAAENMAIDFLLLQRYPDERAMAPRFRHYEWRRPAFTFGYSQKIAFVREQVAATVPPDDHVELCRRPTGGGIVDHRDDWTYALVIPRGHPLEEQRACVSYRAVHEALAEALREQAVAALVKSPGGEDTSQTDGPAGVCFDRAEIADVVHGLTGEKIAGAAQKRNKHGLLFQGSVSKAAAQRSRGSVTPLDWDVFQQGFIERLATALGSSAQERSWPEIDDEEISGLTEQYSSPEWTEYR